MRRKSLGFLIALIFTFCISLFIVGCGKNKEEAPAPVEPEQQEEVIVIKEIKITQPKKTEFECTGDFISLNLGLTNEEKAALKIENAVAVAPGEYTCTITLKDTEHYVLSEDSVTTINWSIVKAKVKKPTLAPGGNQFEYGTVPSLAVEGYTGKALSDYLARYFHIDGLGVKDVQDTAYNIVINIKNTAYFEWEDETPSEDDVQIPYFVYKKVIDVAGPSSTVFTYDGISKSVISQIDAETLALIDVEHGTETNAGTYDFTATLKNDNNYEFSATSQTSFSWTINKAVLTKPSIAGDATNIQYESIPEITVEGITDVEAYLNYFVIPELSVMAVRDEAYSFEIEIAYPDNYEFADNTASVELSYNIVKKELSIPALTTSFVYNGEEQSLDFGFNDYLDSKLTIDGVVAATNAGGYIATVTVNDTDNYKIVGENVDSEGTQKSVNWVISKAELKKPTLTVDGENPHYAYGDEIVITVADEEDAAEYISTYFDVVYPETNVASEEAYTITITIKDAFTANYHWEDDAASVVLTYYIDKAVLKTPELAEGNEYHFTYGDNIEITVADEEDAAEYISTYFDVAYPESNDASEEAYAITITIKDALTSNYHWEDDAANVVLTYYIDQKVLKTPELVEGNNHHFIYGEEIEITVDEEDDADAYIETYFNVNRPVSDDASANAYVIAITIKDTTNYRWSNNEEVINLIYYIDQKAITVEEPEETEFNYTGEAISLNFGDEIAEYANSGVISIVGGTQTNANGLSSTRFTATAGQVVLYFASNSTNIYKTNAAFEIAEATLLTEVNSKNLIYVGSDSFEYLNGSSFEELTKILTHYTYTDGESVVHYFAIVGENVYETEADFDTTEKDAIATFETANLIYVHEDTVKFFNGTTWITLFNADGTAHYVSATSRLYKNGASFEYFDGDQWHVLTADEFETTHYTYEANETTYYFVIDETNVGEEVYFITDDSFDTTVEGAEELILVGSKAAIRYFVLDDENFYETNETYDVEGLEALTTTNTQTLIYVNDSTYTLINENNVEVLSQITTHYTLEDGDNTYFFVIDGGNYYKTNSGFDVLAEGVVALTGVESKDIIYVDGDNKEYLDVDGEGFVALSSIRENYEYEITLVDTTNYYITSGSVLSGTWSIYQTTIKAPEITEGNDYHYIYGEDVILTVDGEDDANAYIDEYFDIIVKQGETTKQSADADSETAGYQFIHQDASEDVYTVIITLKDPANYRFANDEESIILTFFVDKKAITVSVPEVTEFTYSGEEIALDFNLTEEFLGVLSFTNGAKTNSGDYVCTVELIDTTNYYITEGSQLNVGWTINKYVLTKPVLAEDSNFYIYDNVPTIIVSGISDAEFATYFSEFLTVVVNHDANAVQTEDANDEADGFQVAIQDASEQAYTIVISINDIANFCWTDTTNTNVLYDYTVVKKELSVPNPTQTTFTYNGEEKELDLRLDDIADLVLVEGDVETDAGIYTCTVTIIDTINYIFDDQTTSHTYDWTINDYVMPLIPSFDPDTYSISDWVEETSLEYTGDALSLSLKLGGDVLPSVVITTYARGTENVVESINAGLYTSVITLSNGFHFPNTAAYAGDRIVVDWEITKQVLEKPTIAAGSLHVEYGKIPSFAVEGQADGNVYVNEYFNLLWPTSTNARDEAYTVEVTIKDTVNYEWADGAARVLLEFYVDQKELEIEEGPEETELVYTGETVNLDFSYLGEEYNNTLNFVYTDASTNNLVYKNGSNYVYFDGIAWRMLKNTSGSRYVSASDLVYLNGVNAEWFDGTTWNSLTQVGNNQYVDVTNLVYNNGTGYEWFNGTWKALINVSANHYVDKTNLIYNNGATYEYFDGTTWTPLTNISGTHYADKLNVINNDLGTITYFDGNSWITLIEVAEHKYVSATNLVYLDGETYEYFDGTTWTTLTNVSENNYVNKTNLVFDNSGTIQYFDGLEWKNLIQVSGTHYVDRTNLIFKDANDGNKFKYFDGSSWRTLFNVSGTHYVDKINLVRYDELNSQYEYFNGAEWLPLINISGTHYINKSNVVCYNETNSQYEYFNGTAWTPLVNVSGTHYVDKINLVRYNTSASQYECFNGAEWLPLVNVSGTHFVNLVNLVVEEEEVYYYFDGANWNALTQVDGSHYTFNDGENDFYFVVDEEHETFYIATDDTYETEETTLTKVDSRDEVIYFVIDETENAEEYFITASDFDTEAQNAVELTKVDENEEIAFFVIDNDNTSYYITNSSYNEQTTVLEKINNVNELIYFVIDETENAEEYFITASDFDTEAQNAVELAKVDYEEVITYFVVDETDNAEAYFITPSDFDTEALTAVELAKVNDVAIVKYFVIDQTENAEEYYITDSTYSAQTTSLEMVDNKNVVTYFALNATAGTYYITDSTYEVQTTELARVNAKSAVIYFFEDDGDFYLTESSYELEEEQQPLGSVANQNEVMLFVINTETPAYFKTDLTFTENLGNLTKVDDKAVVNYFVIDESTPGEEIYIKTGSDYDVAAQNAEELAKVESKNAVNYFYINSTSHVYYRTDNNYLNQIAVLEVVASKTNAVIFFILDEGNESYYITSNGTSTNVVTELSYQAGINPVNTGDYACTVMLNSDEKSVTNYFISDGSLTQFTLTIVKKELLMPVIAEESNHYIYDQGLPTLTIDGMEAEDAADYIATYFDVIREADNNVGNHAITISIKNALRSNHNFGFDVNEDDIYQITLGYVIDRLTVAAITSPSTLSFDYDGTAKTVDFSSVLGANPYGVTITGNTATNAGNYVAVATLGPNWQFSEGVYTQNFEWRINQISYDADSNFDNLAFRLEISNSPEAAYAMIALDDDFWTDDNEFASLNPNETGLSNNQNASLNPNQSGLSGVALYGYTVPVRHFYANENERKDFYYQDTEKYYLGLCLYDTLNEAYVDSAILGAPLNYSIVLNSLQVGKKSNMTDVNLATTHATFTLADNGTYLLDLNGISGLGDRNVIAGVSVTVSDANHTSKTMSFSFMIKLVWVGPY